MPHKCESVGFVVSQDDRGMILIPTMADTEHPEYLLAVETAFEHWEAIQNASR
jgi:hypothetical protein